MAKTWINTPARKAAARRNIKKAHAAKRRNGKRKAQSIPLSSIPDRPSGRKVKVTMSRSADKALALDMIRIAIELFKKS